jgi:hypothetical protein
VPGLTTIADIGSYERQCDARVRVLFGPVSRGPADGVVTDAALRLLQQPACRYPSRRVCADVKAATTMEATCFSQGRLTMCGEYLKTKASVTVIHMSVVSPVEVLHFSTQSFWAKA